MNLRTLTEKFRNNQDSYTNYNLVMLLSSFLCITSIFIFGLNPYTILSTIVTPTLAGILAYKLKL